jgi:KDO2-lipid IV(A) lauroyltransferase
MYYIVFGFLYLLSLLPLRILYLLSDLAYFLLFRVFGYRKQVVLHNLSIAFPHKSDEEKEKIASRFYRNFTDTFIETIKFISASPAFFRKRFRFDPGILHKAYATGRSVQIHAGHNFNWELVNLAVPPYFDIKNKLGVYLPLNNKTFERLFRYIRTRYGTQLIAATRMREDMIPYRGEQYIIGLIADQSPAVPANAYWVEFFGRPTGFLKGPERAARRNDLPVVFFYFTKSGRGYYEGHMEWAAEHPAQMPEGQLTVQYARFLERVMTANPEMWLWSHRRWKHEWKPEYGDVLT